MKMEFTAGQIKIHTTKTHYVTGDVITGTIELM